MKKCESLQKYLSVSLLVFVVCCASVGTNFAGDWPNWRGPNYDGISTENDWDPSMVKEGIKPIWEASVGIGFSTVSVSNGKVYTMGNNAKSKDDPEQLDVVYCFDALTGKEIWKHSYPNQLDPKYYEGGTLATPTVADGKVYTVSKDGKAFCLKADTGDVIWQKDLLTDFNTKRTTWGISGSPLVLNNMVIYNAASAGIALSTEDGSLIWKNGDGPGGYSTAVPCNVDGVKYLAMFAEKSVVGLDPLTGEIVSEYPWETKYEVNAADPIVFDNRVFITSGYNEGCAMLEITNGYPTLLWQNKNMRSQMSGPVLIDGFLYGMDDNQLACLDVSNGEVKWTAKETAKGSLMAAAGKLIVISEKGKLYIANASPEKFDVIASAQVIGGKCWSMPILANGLIYVRNAAGELVCIDVRAQIVSAQKKTADLTKNKWVQWRGPNRNGKSSETGLLKTWPKEGPNMLWSFEGLGDGFSSMSIADGTIYTAGKFDNEGRIFAIDTDGNKKWDKTYGKEWTRSVPGVRSTPTVEGNNLYFISGIGQVFCFDTNSGEIKWQADPFDQYKGRYPRWGIAESPLIDGEKLFFMPGGDEATMVALDKNTGNMIWVSESIKKSPSYCSPILIERSGKKIIINMTEASIIGVNADTGDILWEYDIADYVNNNRRIHASTPAYYDGCVYLSSGYDMGGVMLSISDDGTEVKKLWVDYTLDNHHGGVLLIDGYLYGSNWNSNDAGDWICLDWKTGKVMYETKWAGNKGSLIYAEGMLYCFDEKEGTVGLVKATPEKFEVTSSFKAPLGNGPYWAHPVICDGRLYIRHGNALMVYDIKEV